MARGGAMSIRRGSLARHITPHSGPTSQEIGGSSRDVSLARHITPHSGRTSQEIGGSSRDVHYQVAAHETQHPPTSEMCLSTLSQQPNDGSHMNTNITSEGLHLGINGDCTNSTMQVSGESSQVVVRLSKRKGRGLAVGIDKPRTLEDRPSVMIENGHPVHKNRECFTTKLGIWAKERQRFPFETLHYDDFEEKVWDNLLEDVKAFFNVDYDGNLREFVKDFCRRKWNDARSKMYRENYACYATHEEALLHPPKHMDPEIWCKICDKVFCHPNWKVRSERNQANRCQQVLIHKSGSKSFAQKIVELRAELGREPYRYEIFKKCYRGENGYANSATETTTERLVELAEKSPENEDRAFLEVLGPEHKGRKRGTANCTMVTENVPSLRAQVEELTRQHVERDKKDAERDIKDADMRSQIAELKTQVDFLMNRHQPMIFNVPRHPQMVYDHQYQVPHQRQIDPSNHQMQMPSFEKQSSVQQGQSFQQHLHRYTDLLQNGDDRNIEMWANQAQAEHELL